MAPELRAELDRLLRGQKFTLDEVVAHLKTMGDAAGEDVPSRSSIHRYAQQVQKLQDRVIQSQEMANRIVEAAGPQISDGKGLQVLIQGFQSLAFDLLAKMEPGETLDPENLQFLARAIASVASAQKTDTDRALKIEQAALKKAADRVEEAVKGKGLSPEVVSQIRQTVLGVA